MLLDLELSLVVVGRSQASASSVAGAKFMAGRIGACWQDAEPGQPKLPRLGLQTFRGGNLGDIVVRGYDQEEHGARGI